MKNAASCLLTLLALLALAGLPAAAAEPPAPTAGAEAVEDAATTAVIGLPEVTYQGNGCFMQYCECELRCRDLSGPAQQACVAQCDEEFEACMNG